MDRLWTPWRFSYVAASTHATTCPFCQLQTEGSERQNLILRHGNHAYVLLNKFPYAAGHLMVVLHRHVATLRETAPKELQELILLSRSCEDILRRVYQPDGFNIGFNIGKSAGAGVAGHLHLHVVPRWQGDANFVSVIGETRVLPEDLESTYEKLLPYFQKQDWV